MYQIDQKSIQKLSEISRLLNSIEVKGGNNISAMYGSMVMLGEIISELQKQIDNSNITIDNTKEKK